MDTTSLRKIGLLSTVMIFFLAMVILLSFSGSGQEKKIGNESETASQGVQQIVSPPVPASLIFAGELVPLNNYEVRERFDRELMVASYFHSNSMLLMKRANRWFPLIEPILKENNIPDDFKYLALIESGLDNVKSPKGAAGYWQFLEKTAREYDLEVNDFIDERYNLEKSTKAACAYFKDSYEEYQSWTMVAAAFNAGNRRITESIEKQGQISYYDLYLNEETSRYVFRILAAKTLLENPENYGFYLTKDDLYPILSLRSVKVVSTISNLVDFAAKNNVTYKKLKQLNPWLRSDRLPDESGRTYFILLPSEN